MKSETLAVVEAAAARVRSDFDEGTLRSGAVIVIHEGQVYLSLKAHCEKEAQAMLCAAFDKIAQQAGWLDGLNEGDFTRAADELLERARRLREGGG